MHAMCVCAPHGPARGKARPVPATGRAPPPARRWRKTRAVHSVRGMMTSSPAATQRAGPVEERVLKARGGQRPDQLGPAQDSARWASSQTAGVALQGGIGQRGGGAGAGRGGGVGRWESYLAVWLLPTRRFVLSVGAGLGTGCLLAAWWWQGRASTTPPAAGGGHGRAGCRHTCVQLCDRMPGEGDGMGGMVMGRWGGGAKAYCVCNANHSRDLPAWATAAAGLRLRLQRVCLVSGWVGCT